MVFLGNGLFCIWYENNIFARDTLSALAAYLGAGLRNKLPDLRKRAPDLRNKAAALGEPSASLDSQAIFQVSFQVGDCLIRK